MKRKIRHFHVVVVQYKKVWGTCNVAVLLCFFDALVAVALPSPCTASSAQAFCLGTGQTGCRRRILRSPFGICYDV